MAVNNLIKRDFTPSHNLNTFYFVKNIYWKDCHNKYAICFSWYSSLLGKLGRRTRGFAINWMCLDDGPRLQYLTDSLNKANYGSRIFMFLRHKYKSRDSVVGIATGYGLDDRRVGVGVPVGSRIFTSPTVQTGSGVHPTSYTMGTGGSFPGVRRSGREADHSPPTSAEVKKMWIYISTPPYVFMT
jgi:hypothetical protein